MLPSEYNEYPCPECEEDVRVGLPAGTHVTCAGCGTLLSIDADAEFDEDGWHDRTTLSIVDPNREHKERMLKHGLDWINENASKTNDCEHKYTEQETAPLGVKCTKCGHFVGNWQ